MRWMIRVSAKMWLGLGHIGRTITELRPSGSNRSEMIESATVVGTLLLRGTCLQRGLAACWGKLGSANLAFCHMVLASHALRYPACFICRDGSAMPHASSTGYCCRFPGDLEQSGCCIPGSGRSSHIRLGTQAVRKARKVRSHWAAHSYRPLKRYQCSFSHQIEVYHDRCA